MNLSQLKIWACAASLVIAGALSAQAQGTHFNNRPGISVVASTVPAMAMSTRMALFASLRVRVRWSQGVS